MLRFSIEKWRAWAPGLSDDTSWRQWALAPYCPYPVDTGELPSTHFLPPMQRRRLSPLARMVFGCAWPLAEGQSPMPMVFASRHGETPRSFQLLSDLASGEPLSPTAFGLSVHNAIAGQWSILRKEAKESVALSGNEDMLEHAIQEACLLLGGGAAQVLVVIAEERPPQVYLPWIDDVPFSHVLALRLKAGQHWHVDTSRSTTADTADIWPRPLNFLRHLVSGTASWSHSGPRRDWHWRHHPANALPT